jgi:hypothetical protein
VVIIVVGIFGGLYALGSLVESMDGANLSKGNSSTSTSTSQPAGQQPAQQPKPQPALPADPQASFVSEVRAYMSQQGWKYPQQLGDTNMTRVAAGIVKSRYLDNSAVVVIITPQRGNCWSGSIMGSDYVQTTYDGCNTGYITIPCSSFFGSYSLAMQRTDESSGNEFRVQVWKGGELLKEAATSASYGVVSFAGSCV